MSCGSKQPSADSQPQIYTSPTGQTTRVNSVLEAKVLQIRNGGGSYQAAK